MSNKKNEKTPEGANFNNQLNCTTFGSECQNLIYVERQKVRINRCRRGAVIRIDAEAAELLEDFATETALPISKLASNFIKFAAARTSVSEVIK